MFDEVNNKLDLSYTWIEVLTSDVISDFTLVDMFNSYSTRISNPVGQGTTRWHYDDSEQAKFATEKLKATGISYRWVEEKTGALIIEYGEELPPLT